ncbi:hypothetical protein M404DRAFT_1005535 [Pisolithus tinctorius Marx 270]|uniref:Secreted protein n=1 Tax=Pisolithus tinctorius Marx 270 TaxID=870435 RepID=A0A0C3NSA5_PISTI|nr:hypothetical protein M404DRAFT_1005535 [Pisolithus tinctorius Marx 270]
MWSAGSWISLMSGVWMGMPFIKDTGCSSPSSRASSRIFIRPQFDNPPDGPNLLRCRSDLATKAHRVALTREIIAAVISTAAVGNCILTT